MAFYFFGALAVIASLLVIAQRNPVYSVLLLITSFGALSGLYILLDAPFAAAIQIIVYAGAIMVLFLFVIMLLGAESLAPSNTLPWQKPLARLLSVILAVEAIYLLFTRASSSMSVSAPDASLNTMESLRDMAMTLFNQFLLPFEVTSILLLVAMLGAIVLSRQEKGAVK